MNNIEKVSIGLMIAALFVIGFNEFQIVGLKGNGAQITAQAVREKKPTESKPLDIDILPKGIPEIYGMELGVSYDDVSPADQKKADAIISRLGTLDQQIILKGDELKRYIAVASRISCEYCCGVDSIIFSDGRAACGCQHSFAMRGLAKYLIKNHGNEYTNDQVLEELGKWKTLFFPSKMAEKAMILKGKGVELNYINIASNKYRGAEKS